VLAINPDSADAYFVRTLIAMANYKQDLAKQYARKAYQLNPNNADIITLYIHAHMYDDTMSEQKTRTLFNEAQHLDPLNANIPYNYGQYLSHKLQSNSEAKKLLKRAISINPMHVDYPAGLSWLYSNSLGNLIDAITQMKIAFNLDNNNPWYPESLPGYYLSLGDTQKAIEYANKISALNINNSKAIEAKVNALIYSEQYDKALQLLSDSLNNPDTVYRGESKKVLIERAVFILLKKISSLKQKH
jgi:tetratricopeptide (TPR) repeat protein